MVSILYVVLNFVLDIRLPTVVVERLNSWWPRTSPLLPTRSNAAARSVSSLSTTALSSARHIELCSGWDGMLNTSKSSLYGSLFGIPHLAVSVPRSPPPPSLSNQASSGCASSDDIFMASTLEYLTSPTAQSLGLSSPVRATQNSPIAIPSLVVPRSKDMRDTDLEMAESTIDSIYSVPWPLPPSDSSPASPSRNTTLVRTCSLASSSSRDSFGFELYPTTPLEGHSRPFQGTMSPVKATVLLPAPTKRAGVRIPSVRRNLRQQWSKESLGKRHSPSASDIVYMTVVQETT
jgi:hypothetical protein